MVGRRGGRGGAVPSATRSAAPPAKISGRRAAATVTATTATSGGSGGSLAALVQSGRGRHRGTAAPAVVAGAVGPEREEEEEDVMLLYRKPSTRPTKPSSSTNASLLTGSASSGATEEEDVLRFWRRVCGEVNRTRALANCSVVDVSLHHGGGGYAVTQDQVFRCSADRLETAQRALHQLADLLYTPPDTSAAAGCPSVGCPCWVRREQYAAAVALARLCEVAVPLQLPSMLRRLTTAGAGVPADTAQDAEGTHGGASPVWTVLPTAPAANSTSEGPSALCLVPAPVAPTAVRQRRRALSRLCQLRVAHTELIPAFRAATTVAELRHVLFAHDDAACQTLGSAYQAWRVERPPPHHHTHASPVVEFLSCFLGSPHALDVVLPLAGITARHPQEEALLQGYVTALKRMTAVDADTWGPMAAMASWRYTDGLYVVHHASRVHTLRRLLAEAQFYGLPRFLRSIRAMAGGHVDAAAALPPPASRQEWQHASVLQRAQGLYRDHFFLTPDGLDPDLFSQPDPMQAQLVQEELVTLQRTHCAFGLVVGEADEVLTLVQHHLRCVGGAWRHGGGEKKEEEDEEEGPGLAGGVKAEPPGPGSGNGDAAAGSQRVVVDGDTDAVPLSACAAAPLPHPHPPRVDPLRRYVVRTVEAARRERGGGAAAAPFSHVQWVEQGSVNRWTPNAHYYGLAYVVVLETEEEWATDDGGTLLTEGLLPETAIAMDAATNTAALRQTRVPAYCVNAVLELWRT
ncbi:hypothetical protein NESM_000057600 [Novymonas esmeraldas]|uniref:Uncharacterized protein n=1 Tax=Novymonas esmeraldas TaxID=1808958 RepID=A0AAW0F0F8_9TRYP